MDATTSDPPVKAPSDQDKALKSNGKRPFNGGHGSGKGGWGGNQQKKMKKAKSKPIKEGSSEEVLMADLHIHQWTEMPPTVTVASYGNGPPSAEISRPLKALTRLEAPSISAPCHLRLSHNAVESRRRITMTWKGTGPQSLVQARCPDPDRA